MYPVPKSFRPFEGHCKADAAPGENEFDALKCWDYQA